MKENHIAMTILVTVSITAALGLVFLFNAESTANVAFYSQQKIYGGAGHEAATPYQRALETQWSRQLQGHYAQYDPETIYTTATPDYHVATYGKAIGKIPSYVSETGGCIFRGDNGEAVRGTVVADPRRTVGFGRCQPLTDPINGEVVVTWIGGEPLTRYCCATRSSSSLSGSI